MSDKLKDGGRREIENNDPTSSEVREDKVHELKTSLGPLDGRAAIFVTDDCLVRYLRARNWDVKKSSKMLKETLKWRAEFKPEEIRWDDVAKEGETGKVYRTNFLDKKGQSVLVMSPGRQNTHDHGGQIRHLVYSLENATMCMPAGTQQMVWLIDFRGWTLKMSPPLKTARETLNILQNHYPERLEAAILYDPPAIFGAFWTIIQPFMDRKTHQKVKFLYSHHPASKRMLEDLFDLDSLEEAFGGKSTWEYDHEAYGALRRQDDIKAALHWGLPPPPPPASANGAKAPLQNGLALPAEAPDPAFAR